MQICKTHKDWLITKNKDNRYSWLPKFIRRHIQDTNYNNVLMNIQL